MSTLTIDLPESLDARFQERVKSSGAQSIEAYLLSLVESDCAAGELDRLLKERLAGSFTELEPGWRDRVLSEAAKRIGG